MKIAQRGADVYLYVRLHVRLHNREELINKLSTFYNSPVNPPGDMLVYWLTLNPNMYILRTENGVRIY